MPIPKPKSNESKSDFMVRCMDDEKMKQEYPTDQRLAICSSSFTELAEGQKISFDYDGTLSTKKGKELFNRLKENNTLYIITARHSADNIPDYGVKVYATGSNSAKIEKIKELGIDKHYDNNKDVVNALKGIGILFN